MYYIDQTGYKIKLTHYPTRIVSLVPSQTELLFDLGLREEIVGITKYCILPEKDCEYKTKIGGTKNFDFKIIEALKPDIIIGNKEENYKEGIEKLREKYPVWLSEIYTFENALDMIQELGTICNKSESTSKLATEIKIGFQKIQIFKKLKFLYFIWKNPYMVVGRNTFINNLLEMIGLENCTEQSRYLSFDGDEIQKMDVDITFLSTEPYKFREKHIKEFSELTPASKIILLDGKVCSWYGSRLKYFPQYINELLRVS